MLIGVTEKKTNEATDINEFQKIRICDLLAAVYNEQITSLGLTHFSVNCY